MSKRVFQLIYTSQASGEMTAETLASILEASRRNNPKVGVTGVLLYRNGRFIQVLEGRQADVQGVFDRVYTDRRHANVRVVLRDETSARDFSEWSMGFRDLSASSLDGQPGLNDFFSDRFDPERFSRHGSLARLLLVAFREMP